MTIQMNPVWLVKLGTIFTHILGIEVIVGSREMWSVVDDWFLIWLLSRKRVSGWFLLINISILVLLDVTNFFIVLFELLSGSKAG